MKKVAIKRFIFSVVVVIALTVAFSITKMTNGVKTAVPKTVGKNQITATFRYLDDKGKPINGNKIIYVFLTSKTSNHRKTFKLQANSTEKIVLDAYDQNGQGKHPLEDEEFEVIVATQKKDKDVKVTDSTKFEENEFDKIENGQIVNGSYRIEIKKDVDMRNKNNGSIEIIVRSLEGRKYTIDEILPPLDLAYSFGIFARQFWLEADVEATIAVEKANKLESDFGLSEHNYEGFYDSAETHKIVVGKKFTKNESGLANGEEVTIELNKKDGTQNPIQTKKCVTDSKGRCSVTFDKLVAGSYFVSEKINGKEITKSEIVQDENGNDITVTIPEKNDITISKQNVNYNYIGDADSSIPTEKFKLREPGTLVVESQTLYDKLKSVDKFNGTEEKIKLVNLNENVSENYQKIDFENEFDKLNDVSTRLAGAIDSEDIKIYYLTSEQIKNKNINFNTDKKQYIVVNVDCTNVNSDSKVEIGGENYRDGELEVGKTFVYEEGSKVIYNFYVRNGDVIKPFSGTIETKGATAGIILAPSATVYGATGNHSGTVIAKEYHHTTGEVHQQFRGITGSLSIANKINIEEKDVNINKIDALSKPVVGAKMQLLNDNGDILEEWTTNGTTHKLTTSLKKGKKYTIREAYAPDNYQPSKDFEFIYDETKEQNYNIVDTQLIVNKYDENRQYLSGATLQIVDEHGYVLEEWISDGTPHIVKESLNIGQKYFLHEKYAPLGYKESEDVEFTLNADGKNQTVEMEDQKLIVNISVEKKDWNDKLLAGAHLQILDSNKTLVEEWVSDGSSYKVQTKLNIGEKYILHEVSAPEGYEVSPDVEFTVENTEEEQVIKITDNKIKIAGEPFVKILKTNKEGKLLEGAQLQLLDSNGKVIEEWTSNDKVHNVDAKLEVGKKYTLHEKKAPDGYQKAGDVTFTAREGEQEIKMIDERIRRVEGIVETVDEITKYLTLFSASLVLLLGGFIIFSQYNKKKLSK